MRLYRIEFTLITTINKEEILEQASLIVPELALADHEFDSCVYVGDLDDRFLLIRKETPQGSPDDRKDINVVKLKKKE